MGRGRRAKLFTPDGQPPRKSASLTAAVRDRTGEDLRVLDVGSLRGSGPDTHTLR